MIGSGPSARRAGSTAAHALVVTAIAGACWGGAEALVAWRAGGDDALTVACFYPLVTGVAALPAALVLFALPATAAPHRAVPLLAGALFAFAAAVPLAVWGSQTLVRGASLLSAANASLAGGAVLVGLLPGAVAWWLARRWMTRGGGASRARVAAVAAGVLLVACAARCADVLVPDDPGPWPDNRARVGPRPNVVVLLLDTLRADHLSAYGYERVTSPRLDALVAARFTRAYAQAHWTPPSTASLLTGLYPAAHQTNLVAAVMPEEVETLTQVLQRAGYVTGYVTGNFAVSGAFGFTRGADWVVSERRLPPHRLHPSSLGRLLVALVDDLTRADQLNEWVLPFLRSVRERRFFLYAHYKDPHQPYEPPRPWDEAFDPGFEGRRILDPAIRSQWPISERERQNMVARYDGEVRFLDEQVGAVLDELERLGLRDETIVLVTADHGEEFLDHGGWLHGQSVYEEMVRVPLFLAWPPLIREPRVIDARVRLVDVVPTLLELLRLPDSPQAQGESLVPLLSGEHDGGGGTPATAERDVLVEGATTGHTALLRGRHKLIRVRAGGAVRYALYDLAADPHERRDLAADHAALVEELAAAMETAEARYGAAARGAVQRALGPAEERALRELGYIR